MEWDMEEVNAVSVADSVARVFRAFKRIGMGVI